MSDVARGYRSFIYVCGVAGGPAKIGHSGDVLRRVKQLSAEYGERLVITGKWPIGQAKALAAERYVHWLLRDHHITGEWFDAPRDVILAAVNKALAMPMDSEPVPALDPGGRLRLGEQIVTAFPKGTKARLRELLGDQGHADLIREAVERELRRRERIAHRSPED